MSIQNILVENALLNAYSGFVFRVGAETDVFRVGAENRCVSVGRRKQMCVGWAQETDVLRCGEVR